MKISEKIIILRKRKGFSQEDLANELDVSRQSVYKWETGNATPDISKIKKMASLFNVSFDEFLDDTIDLTIEGSAKPAVQSAGKRYRQVLHSNLPLSFYQGEIDHGYPKQPKKKNRQSSEIFSFKMRQMKSTLKNYGADSYILLQSDIAGCFFQNSKNMTFGFYFGGAIQFLCPYENYISSAFSNSGNELSHENRTVLGTGWGAGGLQSIGGGSIPVATLNKPSTYTIIVSYFNHEGQPKEYKLSLNCFRTYTIYDLKNVDECRFFNNLLSSFTNERILEISARLNALPAMSERLHSGETTAPKINMAAVQELQKAASNEAASFNKKIEQQQNAEKASRQRIALIALAIIAGIAIFIFISDVISTVNQQKSIDRANQEVAQPVVDMINEIGDVTLEDKQLLKKIATAYSKLTSEQRKHVSNFAVYDAAQQQYTALYEEHLEESTKDDPTRNITLSDLKGTWQSGNSYLQIEDFGNALSVCVTCSEDEEQIHGHPNIAFSCQSSTLGEYDPTTKRKTGVLFHATPYEIMYDNFTVTVGSYSGNLLMTIAGKTYTKISND